MSRVFLNRNSAASEKELPIGTFRNSFIIKSAESKEKMKYIPVGAFPLHPDGAHEITREKLEQMIANQANDLMIDLGHESMWNAGARAYGWIPRESLEVREDGLYGNSPEWTPDAAEMVKNRHYRFLSPAYQLQSQDKKTGEDRGARLWPIALTNTPYFDAEIDALKNSAIKTEETLKMQYTAEFKKKIGLKEDATDAEVELRLDALLKSDLAATEAAANAKTEDEKSKEKSAEAEAVANSAAILEAIKNLQAELDGIKNAGIKEKAETLINSAITDGKIMPADKMVWLNSALANFDDTKKQLDARKKNSAMPSAVKLPSEGEQEKTESPRAALKNSATAFVDAVKNSGFKIRRDALIN